MYEHMHAVGFPREVNKKGSQGSRRGLRRMFLRSQPELMQSWSSQEQLDRSRRQLKPRACKVLPIMCPMHMAVACYVFLVHAEAEMKVASAIEEDLK